MGVHSDLLEQFSCWKNTATCGTGMLRDALFAGFAWLHVGIFLLFFSFRKLSSVNKSISKNKKGIKEYLLCYIRCPQRILLSLFFVVLSPVAYGVYLLLIFSSCSYSNSCLLYS